MTALPLIDKNICTRCRLCADDCTARAINRENLEILDHRCIFCGHCIAICPEDAISAASIRGSNLSDSSEHLTGDLEKLIKMRRSVRHYRNEPVPREVIEKIIDTVIHCPTGTNSRMTGITILDSREQIKELTDIIMEHFEKLTGLLLNAFTFPFLILFLGRKKTKKLFSYKRQIHRYWKGENILTHDAPALMIFHGNKKASTPSQDGLIWATTAMLLAESHGIGTCFNGFLVIGINSCRKARKYLRLPRNNKIFETFTAGYSKYKYKRSVPREREYVRFL